MTPVSCSQNTSAQKISSKMVSVLCVMLKSYLLLHWIGQPVLLHKLWHLGQAKKRALAVQSAEQSSVPSFGCLFPVSPSSSTLIPYLLGSLNKALFTCGRVYCRISLSSAFTGYNPIMFNMCLGSSVFHLCRKYTESCRKGHCHNNCEC